MPSILPIAFVGLAFLLLAVLWAVCTLFGDKGLWTVLTLLAVLIGSTVARYSNVGWLEIGFVIGLVSCLALDLGVFNRKDHEIKLREALIWSAVWVSIGCLFGLVVYLTRGSHDAANYFTAYVLEKSLSVDNLFVFAQAFALMAVPADRQHRVLFWGVIGALVMRAIFIIAGVEFVQHFSFLMYVFGSLLVYVGFKMAFADDEDKKAVDFQKVIRWLGKIGLPVVSIYEGRKFFTVSSGVQKATMLFVAVVVAEISDLVFAIDSVPAVIAVSTSSFIAYTSNAFAILGLRSIYFALNAVLPMCKYLGKGLAVVLTFIGVKMILHQADWVHIPNFWSLAVVGFVLLTSVILSFVRTAEGN